MDDFMESVEVGYQQFALFASMDKHWYGAVVNLQDMPTLETMAAIALQAWLGRTEGSVHHYSALLTECLSDDGRLEPAHVLIQSTMYKIAALILDTKLITFDQIRGVGLAVTVNSSDSGTLEPTIWFREEPDEPLDW
jgi:hypothetical protein